MLVFLSVFPFAAAAMFTLIINALLPALGFAWSWIFGVNIASFLTYGYDKAIAGRSVTRVPEAVLHLLTLFGGMLGSFLAMHLFRHKTHKTSFRIAFWVIVIVQIIVIVWLTRHTVFMQRMTQAF
jgi:uncharacterized membrane protein YsdA (DUF1294 family)